MIHPHTQLRFINEQLGYGIFATAVIPTGTIVYVQDGLDIVIPPDSPLLLDPVHREQIDKYAVLEPPNGRRVIGWDIAKYVNHCCHPNVLSTGYGFEIALQDIQPGEEIRDDYALFNLDWDLTLICQYQDCRGRIKDGDAETLNNQWDARIQAALKNVVEVPQPLWSFLDGETETALQHYLHSGDGYLSVRRLRMGQPGLHPA
jgi:uncharacterized protein